MSGGSGILAKTGTGTLTLSGDNSYSGDMTVSAGRLSFTGSSTTSDIAVDSGGTLNIDAAGMLNAGDITISSGGSLVNLGAVTISVRSTTRAAIPPTSSTRQARP